MNQQAQESRSTSMSTEEFDLFAQLIDKELGIKMPIAKKTMLESRLQKRLRVLGFSSFSQYYEQLNHHALGSEEMVEFRNMVTTNKTDFFRESNHFDYINKTLLPKWIEMGRTDLTLWTCACSSGEEPYTMAMVMEELRRNHPSLNYKIIATDISTKVLAQAKEGLYTQEDINIIPLEMQRRYLLKGKGNQSHLYRIKDTLKQRITFGRFNLMNRSFHTVPGPADIIFCRNVLIYFERFRQEEIIRKLMLQMKPKGVLFLGHSESMAGMNLQLKSLASSVYTEREELHG